MNEELLLKVLNQLRGLKLTESLCGPSAFDTKAEFLYAGEILNLLLDQINISAGLTGEDEKIRLVICKGHQYSLVDPKALFYDYGEFI